MSLFEHFGVVPEQSAAVRHWTQWSSLVLQRGVAVGQLASVVHPATHVRRFGWQTGVVPLQSLFSRHSAHSPSGRHRGDDAGQSVFTAHVTHVNVVTLQMGVFPEQSAFVRHVSHAPVDESQYGAITGRHPVAPGAEHDAWQAWSPGQHAGALVPQSPLFRQATHPPLTQNFVASPQSVSARHSTQPAFGSHLAGHAVAFAQTLPTPMPLFELLHAPTSATAVAKQNERTAPRPRTFAHTLEEGEVRMAGNRARNWPLGQPFESHHKASRSFTASELRASIRSRPAAGAQTGVASRVGSGAECAACGPLSL